ncbi:septum formation initiator family protein [Thermodesulfobacteriota bacterium]
MKRALRYTHLVIILVGMVTAIGLMGEKGFNQKGRIEDKKELLTEENGRLAMEIRSLERHITLLRSDTRAIGRAAKHKLGMARPDEMVYVFSSQKQATRAISCTPGLYKGQN